MTGKVTLILIETDKPWINALVYVETPTGDTITKVFSAKSKAELPSKGDELPLVKIGSGYKIET